MTVSFQERRNRSCIKADEAAVLGNQHAEDEPAGDSSAVRQFLARRFVKGRDGDEADIADHIDQNFHPYGHGAPFPQINSDGQVLVPARSDDQTREIAWLAIAAEVRIPCTTKTPPTSEDEDGVFRAFTSRKVAALS